MFKMWIFDREIGWYEGLFDYVKWTISSRFTKIDDLEYFVERK